MKQSSQTCIYLGHSYDLHYYKLDLKNNNGHNYNYKDTYCMFEQIQSMLWNKCKMSISNTDIILMVATLTAFIFLLQYFNI